MTVTPSRHDYDMDDADGERLDQGQYDEEPEGDDE